MVVKISKPNIPAAHRSPMGKGLPRRTRRRRLCLGNEPPNQMKYFQGEWTGPKRVGEWHANGYGLFNIGDNVHEWCMDWYAENYYAVSPNKNPAGPQTGTRRVSRGGSWRHQIKASRAAHRSSLPPPYAYTDYGFRICRGAGVIRGQTPNF